MPHGRCHSSSSSSSSCCSSTSSTLSCSSDHCHRGRHGHGCGSHHGHCCDGRSGHGCCECHEKSDIVDDVLDIGLALFDHGGHHKHH
ncbi:hypothetical protein GMRT_jh005 [Giardia muris]|uniref:Uncharacterized protein n=1 Tax=Giardia muris TaxID=5742 RepID=A0A4Z1T0C1_GIAMU|nr:hypothetical protein GMRT_jh005 [Giardia muris]|eukprot:TNJ29148.1 hypothetical protein GMRT_jh005 [Giardia muris]